MDCPSNIVLLLLQLVLQRQQTLAHRDKSVDLQTLLKDPVIDNDVLVEFKTHKLVQLYGPQYCRDISLRGLKTMVIDIFANGIPRNAQSSGNDQPVTVVDLANYYYMQRINELQNTELPQLKEALLTRLEHMI
ncbi:BCN_G0039320.mRNA.1.CDS.1 [Saccharomyces cerevisiae]|nr:BCN_G0039320.mRNA.1.CDS.1 [Saccharomyces cerevisiae]CAI4669281.1 BCE_3a_G0039330.mRNA.1.CDS.1 [Saccharomyces cerevisiae]CAI7253615.1 BCN_G0039320.mRNA.1.CDS.1 [Saccharomyces cerevisiae]CAI7257289.1 BCE_3a_G0039330.mRNA.1.CDS.1 [Saccharomyces cerevisiae]